MQNLLCGKRLHFIGCGGVSMSALLQIAAHYGAICTGTDRADGVFLRGLLSAGYRVMQGENPLWAGAADLVVYTAGVRPDHPERLAAKRTMERSELLAQIAAMFPTVVAVAGTHGKTTVCAMLAQILLQARIPFTAHIGGYVHALGGSAACLGEQVFLTEACEYRRHFLTLSPHIGVITNIQFDHPDYYRDFADVCTAFTQFANRCTRLVTTEEVLACLPAHTCTCTYADACISPLDMRAYSFQYRDTSACFPVTLPVWGDFNAADAMLACRTARLLHIDEESIRQGLRHYRGTARRQQTIGFCDGVPVVVDYAHHPTEIQTVLHAARLHFGRLLCLFQPHTYSRTVGLLDQFVHCFDDCELVLLLPTYAAREAAQPDVDRQLAARIAAPCQSVLPTQLVEQTKKALQKNYNAVIVVGAGDIDTLAAALCDRLDD